jgi:AcrR family transcriptional regulator
MNVALSIFNENISCYFQSEVTRERDRFPGTVSVTPPDRAHPMPRTRTNPPHRVRSKPAQNRRAEESEQRRQRILAAAGQHFGVMGFQKTRIEEIARSAGVSNGCLYTFFTSKEHLFEVVVEQVLEGWKARLDAVVAQHRGRPSQALQARYRASLEYAFAHPLLAALFSQEQIVMLSTWSDVVARVVDDSRVKVGEILREGVDTGEFRSDLRVDAIADAICELGIAYVNRVFRTGSHEPLDPELVDATIEWILNGLRA